MESVCICVLNYNNGLRTIGCLKSLIRQSFRKFLVIVIDNCSTDNSVELINTFLAVNDVNSFGMADNPKFFLLQMQINAGYAAGNNAGMRYAKEAGSFTHILILNNDTELPENFLEEMILKYRTETLKCNTGRIALGAIQTDKEGRTRNKGFHYLNITTGLAFKYRMFPSFRYIIGSCIFLPVTTPLMDERFFLYYDDAMFTKILKKENYILSNLSTSFYVHELGGTTKNRPNLHLVIFRSMKIFYKDNYPYFFPLVVFIRCIQNLMMGRLKIAYDLLRISIFSKF